MSGKRGGKRNSNNKNKNNYNSKTSGNSGGKNSSYDNKKEMKFSPHVYGKQQTYTYATIKEHIIQNVQLDYGVDVAKSLKSGEPYHKKLSKPQRQISNDIDPVIANIEQSGYDIEYREDLRRFHDRYDKIEQDLVKVYSVIFTQYCTKTMQLRIEEHPDFVSKIDDNPIQLLEVIKTLMHDTVRGQYPMVSITDALVRLVTMRQYDNESFLDYLKRFKQTRDVAKSYWGNHILDTYIKNTSDYNILQENIKILKADTNSKQEDIDVLEEEQNRMVDDAWETWLSYILLKGSDQNKYGTLMKGFVSQYSLGNDQYPKTLQGAADALSQHKLDQKYYDNMKKNKEKKSNNNTNSSNTTNDDVSGSSFAQKKGNTNNKNNYTNKTKRCFCCGSEDHLLPQCDKKDKIPKDKWFFTRVMAQISASDNERSSDDEDSDEDSVWSAKSSKSRSGNSIKRSNSKSGWSGFQGYNTMSNNTITTDIDINTRSINSITNDYNFTNLKDVFILDSGSTIDGTIMNPDFVTNVRPSKSPIGMTTNVGAKLLNIEAEVPGFGRVWFDPEQMANIFGLSKMSERYRITYDSEIDDAFFVHTDDGIIRFGRTDEGLYAYRPSRHFLDDIDNTKNLVSITN